MEHTLTLENDKNVDDEDTLSDQECEFDPVDWNDDEKSIFIEAVNNYGKDFARISSCVKSKSYEQCKVFFSKARKSLGLDLINQGAAGVSMPSTDANGGRSDSDEACAIEMDSAIISTQSCAKAEMDVCPTERAIQGPSSCIISKQTEGDESKDCDVLDVKTEEGENKADKTSTLDQKRFSEVGHRSTCGPIDINCPETTEKLEDTYDTVDQMNVHISSAIISSKEQPEVRMVGCSHVALDNALVKAGNSAPSASIVAESGIKENVRHFSKMTGASTISPAFTSSYQHSMPGDKPPSKPKPQVTPLTPKDLMPVQFSSALPDPTSIRFEGIASITTSNFEDTGISTCNALEAKDMNKYPCFKDKSQTGQLDTLFRNIDGYTNHLATEPPIFSERNTSGTVSTSQSDRFTITKFQNVRSSSLGLPNTTDGIHWDREHNEASDGSLRPCSCNTSSGGNEQIKRQGDVKLFGQILSHQSSQNSGSSCNGIKSKPSSPNFDTSSMRLLKNPRDHVSCSSRPAVTTHLGLEDRSLRSYGHLDGSIAQPEPLFVMAKCQTSLSGVPFYSAKNGTLGVFSDYQQPLMQAHQSDPKRLERYSDSHKRNGLEFMSGFQQPGKVSRFGGAGILVSGVSDPVAALKAQYGPGSKISSCEVDPWKDIGSR
jgi:nuclear receptor co-repressor 1